MRPESRSTELRRRNRILRINGEAFQKICTIALQPGFGSESMKRIRAVEADMKRRIHKLDPDSKFGRAKRRAPTVRRSRKTS